MKYFLSLITISFLLISCESKKEKSEIASKEADTSFVATAVNKDHCNNGIYIKHAHSYNNYIIEYQGSILQENIRFIKAVKAEAPKETLEKLYKTLEEQTQKSIDSLDKLCSFNGNEEYKKSSLELFKFYKSAWSDYKKLLKEDTKQARLVELAKLRTRFNDKYAAEEKKLEENFNMAHTNFVDDYMLHVRSTPLHAELDSMIYIR
jgi:hypothetical protein